MITKEQIDIAVAWWGDALRSPTSQTQKFDPRFSYRYKDRDAGVQRLMTVLSRSEVLEEEIALFRSFLRERLRGLASGIHEKASIKLDVDYHPDEVLDTALKKAGIDEEERGPVLPLKTVMWLFNDGEMVVAEGYGNPFETLLEI